MLNENQYYRDLYGLQIITNELAKKLEGSIYTDKPIQGISWYNILANPEYQQKFAYLSAQLTSNINKNEIMVHKDGYNSNNYELSDLVSIVLNLALIDSECVKMLKVGPRMNTILRNSKRRKQEE